MKRKKNVHQKTQKCICPPSNGRANATFLSILVWYILTFYFQPKYQPAKEYLVKLKSPEQQRILQILFPNRSLCPRLTDQQFPRNFHKPDNSYLKTRIRCQVLIPQIDTKEFPSKSIFRFVFFVSKVPPPILQTKFPVSTERIPKRSRS